MNSNLQRLLAVAGDRLSDDTVRLDPNAARLAGALAEELLELLWARNGFYAFESALHVFPATTSKEVIGLDRWNSLQGWRSDYGDLSQGCLFFAEDLVGGQFCVVDGAFYKFDPETGDRQLIGHSIAEWASVILKDDESQTLWPLGHKWQEKHGPLPTGKRLGPKTPFVLGGHYAPDNLYLVEPEKLMRFYANLARQIHDLPEGARVELKVID